MKNLTKITVTLLAFCYIGIVVVAGCTPSEEALPVSPDNITQEGQTTTDQGNRVQEKPESVKPPDPRPAPKRDKPKEYGIIKHVTQNPSLLYDGEPIRYATDEIYSRLHDSLGDRISEEAKLTCINKISEYFYAFPGYRYQGFAVVMREPSSHGTANVYIRTSANTITNEDLVFEMFKNSGDSLYFGFKYDEEAQTCEMGICDSNNTLIPDGVEDKAWLLAEEHPVVKEFLGYHGGYPKYGIEWINELAINYTPDRELYRIPFNKPVKGVIVIDFYDPLYGYEFFVYVDIFNGEVITEGPFDPTIPLPMMPSGQR